MEKEEQKKPADSEKSQGSKVLPKKKEEEEKKRARSKTPQRQREKDKRKRDRVTERTADPGRSAAQGARKGRITLPGLSQKEE